MSIFRILGLVVLAVGVMLLVCGYNASQSVSERVVEGLTGYFSNQTMWYILGGVAAIVGGAVMALRRGQGAA